MPAISRRILTSPADIGWSVRIKIHKLIHVSSVRSRVEDFAVAADGVELQVDAPRTGSSVTSTL